MIASTDHIYITALEIRSLPAGVSFRVLQSGRFPKPLPRTLHSSRKQKFQPSSGPSCPIYLAQPRHASKFSPLPMPSRLVSRLKKDRGANPGSNQTRTQKRPKRNPPEGSKGNTALPGLTLIFLGRGRRERLGENGPLLAHPPQVGGRWRIACGVAGRFQ